MSNGLVQNLPSDSTEEGLPVLLLAIISFKVLQSSLLFCFMAFILFFNNIPFSFFYSVLSLGFTISEFRHFSLSSAEPNFANVDLAKSNIFLELF